MSHFAYTRAAWRYLVTNIRRWASSYLMGWVVDLTPPEDAETLVALIALLDAMDVDADLAKHDHGMEIARAKRAMEAA